ncbi:hypothetical protein [Halobacteriaceae bacterium SHR40]|uniref:hypothetical protein n=1 Tax=Halovenus amylolytica TaxID=2500550 RepID=UPI000FE3D8B8
MGRLSRRQFTGLLASGATLLLSGCTEAFGEYLGNDQEGKLLVVTTNLRVTNTTGDETEYPADIAARIVVENRRSERQQATLEAILRHDRPAGEPEEWTNTRELNLGRGVSPTIEMLFESVFEEGDKLENYEIEAAILGPGE